MPFQEILPAFICPGKPEGCGTNCVEGKEKKEDLRAKFPDDQYREKTTNTPEPRTRQKEGSYQIAYHAGVSVVTGQRWKRSSPRPIRRPGLPRYLPRA